MKYIVTFSYTYEVEAESNQEAEEEAIALFDNEAPRSDEMNINVEWTKDIK